MSGTFCGPHDQVETVADLIEPKPKGHAFKFKLNDNTGGTYRTPEATDVDGATDQLLKKYGLRVASVELLGVK